VKIFLVGATGFLGKYLCRVLPEEGHILTALVRPGSNLENFGRSVNIVTGNPAQEGDWQESLAEHDTVINLAGTSIFQRWTKKIKNEILESRVLSTKNIVNALKGIQGREECLLNASGVGYYGFHGNEIVDELHPHGDTFLASVAEAWESAARMAEETGVRVVQCRFGIILGRNGGAFRHMLPLFRHRLGATWGTGEQWFSWIHEQDAARIIFFLLKHKGIRGPVNFTSPNPVTNLQMTETFNRLLNKKPCVRRLPEWFFRLTLGEFAEVFLEGQRVLPQALLQKGFTFRFPALNEAITDLIQ
jgi:uncharacterized protein